MEVTLNITSLIHDAEERLPASGLKVLVETEDGEQFIAFTGQINPKKWYRMTYTGSDQNLWELDSPVRYWWYL